MRPRAALLTITAFVIAAGLSLLMAWFLGNALESRSVRHVKRALTVAVMPWVDVRADGLEVTLSGTAPTEAMRFRAATVAARVVGGSRIVDEMDVVPASSLVAPRFSLELLRNDDGLSIIGLVPTKWDDDDFVATAAQLADSSLTNMMETADFPVPEHWQQAVDFGLAAMRLLPRSKISISADGVQVTAISDSPAQKRRLDADLARAIPEDVKVRIDISAPRPVIAPFTLRFVKDIDGARFDACAAETERNRSRILAAGIRAGAQTGSTCTLGLGSPSPRWPEAAEIAIAALDDLGSGTVTISDIDVTLIADASVSQHDFERVIGELTNRLPDVFSLKAWRQLPERPEGSDGIAQFIAIRAPDGKLQLRGRLVDDRMRDVVDAYARARFGASNVNVNTRLDAALPVGWGSRVLAGMSALAELDSGSLLVEPDRVRVKGISGNQNARASISGLLADHLGQGQDYSVDVTYDRKLDLSLGLPTPAECLADVTEILNSRHLTFAPGSVKLEGEAQRIVSSIAEVLEKCEGARLEVGGHTDSQGRAESNMTLSQKRAEAVLQGLADRGIDIAAMSARGYGATQPIADNATEEGRYANRRIAFSLLDASGAPVAVAAPDAAAELPAHDAPPQRPGDLAGAPAGAAAATTGTSDTDAETDEQIPADADAEGEIDEEPLDEGDLDAADLDAHDEPDPDELYSGEVSEPVEQSDAEEDAQGADEAVAPEADADADEDAAVDAAEPATADEAVEIDTEAETTAVTAAPQAAAATDAQPVTDQPATDQTVAGQAAAEQPAPVEAPAEAAASAASDTAADAPAIQAETEPARSPAPAADADAQAAGSDTADTPATLVIDPDSPWQSEIAFSKKPRKRPENIAP